nr:hypothetical protein [Pedobacter duraquae]
MSCTRAAAAVTKRRTGFLITPFTVGVAFLNDDMGYFSSHIRSILTRQESKQRTIQADK